MPSFKNLLVSHIRVWMCVKCQGNLSFSTTDCALSILHSDRRFLLAPPRVLNQQILLFHSNRCTSDTPKLPRPNAPFQQTYTAVSAKFR